MTELWTFSLCKRTIKNYFPTLKIPRGHNDCLEILAKTKNMTAIEFYNTMNPLCYFNDTLPSYPQPRGYILSEREYGICMDNIRDVRTYGMKTVMKYSPLPGKPKVVNEVIDLTADLTVPDLTVSDLTNLTNLTVPDLTSETQTDVISMLKDIQSKIAILLARNCPF